MQSLISVIIPVYKVDEYLDRCIESLVEQTHTRLEIVLVDDGSTDQCSRMCDEWTKKDARIGTVHKRNGGLSDARNAGMPLATGDYISFIDSDDYISNDFFDVMLQTAVSENSDIVECSVVKFYDDKRFDEYFDDLKVKSYSVTDGLAGLIAEDPFHQHVWNKLYRIELTNDIFYPVGKLNEDEFWTYQIFGRAKRVTKINKTMYFYFQRAESIMGESYNLRRLDALEGKKNRQAFMEKNFPTLVLRAKVDFFGSCIFSEQAALKYLKKDEKKEAVIKIKQYRNTCKLNKDELAAIPGKDAFWFKFADKHFWLCCKVRALSGIGF